MRVRKSGEEDWVHVSEETFGSSVKEELTVYGKQFPIEPCDQDFFNWDNDKGCIHVYGQIIRISPLLEEASIEAVACSNCKFFRMSTFAAESRRLGYCTVDGFKDLKHAAHDCDCHEPSDNWKTRFARL